MGTSSTNNNNSSSSGYASKVDLDKHGRQPVSTTASLHKTSPSSSSNVSLQQHNSNHGTSKTRTLAAGVGSGIGVGIRTSPNTSAIPAAPPGTHEHRRLGMESSKIPQLFQCGSQTARATIPTKLPSKKQSNHRHNQDTVPSLPVVKNPYMGFGTYGGIDAAKTERSYNHGSSNGSHGHRSTVALTARQQRSPRRAVGGGTGSTTVRTVTRSNTMNSNSGNSSSVSSGTHSGPISVRDVLRRYQDQLTDFEQSEILHYTRVYFIGKTRHKIKGTPHSAYLNYGYDDELGNYSTVAHDHIAFRYEIHSSMGKGSFGQVLKCFDHKTRTFVALKIIRNKKRFHAQALIEIKVLQKLREQDPENSNNVIHLKESFFFRNHLCITFELMSINLYEMTKQNNYEGVSLGLTRRFAMQILVSLKFLRDQKIVHCDLKPENILLKEPDRSAIKVIDFGSSCFEDETQYTYIQSRFYRAPEVILGLPYGPPIDMWSLGCILAELYTGYPIFPGENEQEQLLCIMEVLGEPPRSMLGSSTKWRMFFDASYRPRIVASSRGKKRYPGTKDIASKIRCRDKLFLMFLEGCLRWEPHLRMTPEEALQHQWIAERLPPSTERKPQPTTLPSNPQGHRNDFKYALGNSNLRRV
eukprot:g4540.t1